MAQTGDKLITLDELKAVKDYITPAHIGAVAKSGDTMTGNLNFIHSNMVIYGTQDSRRWLLYPKSDQTEFYIATQEKVNEEWSNWRGVVVVGSDGSIALNQPLNVTAGGTGARNAPDALTSLGAMPVNPTSIELKPASGTTHGGFIDFHYGGSTADYTTRIIEYQNGVLGVKKPNESVYYPIMLLRSVEINATTSVNGNLQLPLLYSAGVPLAIKAKTSDGVNVYCAIGRYNTADNGYWGAKIFSEITSGESPVALKNTAIVGTLYYVSM